MATKRVYGAYNARDTAKSGEEEKAFLRLDRWDASLTKSLILEAGKDQSGILLRDEARQSFLNKLGSSWDTESNGMEARAQSVLA